MKRALSLLALAAASTLALPALTHADIIRESTGQRRVMLDKMELQNAPSFLDGLAAWSGGEALKSADISGKPVLLVNWASWNAASVRALSLAQRMADKFAKEGLVVVGIHHPNGWEGAAEAAKGKGATFLIAHDKDGAYRKAFSIDHEPEYYIIDRAGHLRYASVSAGSVEEALTEVTAETVAAAGDVPNIRNQRQVEATRKAGLTTAIRDNFELQSIPAVPPGFLPPAEDAYKDIKWPRVEKELGKAWGLLDNDDKPLFPKLAFAPVAWHPKPPTTAGRVQVIYFWHPELNMTYSGIMDKMDQLQEQHGRDIALTGALIGLKVLKGDQQQSSPNQEEETYEKLKKKWDRFIASRHYSHSLAADIGMTCLAGMGQNQGGSKFPVPGAMIVSTDGTVRWMGWTYDNLGRMEADFKSALDKTIANDPGVKARRAADRAYIENKKR